MEQRSTRLTQSRPGRKAEGSDFSSTAQAHNTVKKMTPEQDDRIRVLAKLIAYETNAERLHVLASEMEHLLSARLHEIKSNGLPPRPRGEIPDGEHS